MPCIPEVECTRHAMLDIVRYGGTHAVAGTLRAESAYERDGHTARTLVRERHLRIVLIAMKSGSQISEHRSQDSVSLQTLVGNVRITLPTHVVELPASSKR